MKTLNNEQPTHERHAQVLPTPVLTLCMKIKEYGSTEKVRNCDRQTGRPTDDDRRTDQVKGKLHFQ